MSKLKLELKTRLLKLPLKSYQRAVIGSWKYGASQNASLNIKQHVAMC